MAARLVFPAVGADSTITQGAGEQPYAFPNYRVTGRIWRGSRRNYYIAPYGPYYIWGATARVLHSLSLRLSA